MRRFVGQHVCRARNTAVIMSARCVAASGEAATSLTQHTTPAADAPALHVDAPPTTQRAPIPFFFKGRRGWASSQFYVSRSTVGHPDPVANFISGGRPDYEWMWIKFLCFICVVSTIGTSVYGIFFGEHIKRFKDEPWSPFRN